MKLKLTHIPLLVTVFVVVMVLSGCQTAAITPVSEPIEIETLGIPAPPVGPTKAKRTMLAWEGKHPKANQWTAHIYSVLPTLGKDMLATTPADYKTFCPKFKSLTPDERVDFYAQLVSVMARHESRFKPETKYDETSTKPSLKGVISRGLLQISLASSKSYGCGLKSGADLHDAANNLSCGVRILNRWIGQRDHLLAGKVAGGWKGGARYWSVMRTTSRSYAKVTAYTKQLEMCK